MPWSRTKALSLPGRARIRLDDPDVEASQYANHTGNSASRNVRRRYIWLGVMLGVVLLALSFEYMTKSMATLLDNELFTHFKSDKGGDKSGGVVNGRDGTEASNQDNWSTGSAFVAVAVLQLGCILQPGGSSIFDGATGLWRLSPIYCLWDMATTYATFCTTISRFPWSPRLVFAGIAAARYRSSRTVDFYALSVMDQRQFTDEMIENHIQQDIHDAFWLPRKRRVLSAVVSLVNIAQFTKLAVVRGSFQSAGFGQLLGVVYFSYWLTNESLVHVLRFSNSQTSPVEKERALLIAKTIRPQWLFTVDHRTGIVSDKSKNMFFGGICHCLASAVLAALVFGIGSHSLAGRVEIHNSVRWLLMAWFYMLPAFCLLLCLWSLVNFSEGFEKDRMGIHFWYALQGSQALLLILLFYLCIFDPSETTQPSWTDWLP